MAKGIAHSFNFLKFRLLESLVNNRNIAMTTREISKATRIPAKTIANAMYHYNKWGYRYFRRLKPKSGKAFRYKITSYGIITYKKYLKRVILGVDLNCLRRYPKEMSTYHGLHVVCIKTKADRVVTPEQVRPYIRVTKRGAVDMGISEYEKLRIAGF